MKELLQLGSWERFFRPVLGVCLCHPLVGRSALKQGGFHILLSSLLARTLCVSLSPTKEWVLALLPLALPWGLVCFGSLAVILFAWAFHALVFHAWGLASGSSGSRASWYGLLVYVQGASDSLPHSSPGREVGASVFGIVVRTLLQATSPPLGMAVSPAPGRRLSVSTF